MDDFPSSASQTGRIGDDIGHELLISFPSPSIWGFREVLWVDRLGVVMTMSQVRKYPGRWFDVILCNKTTLLRSGNHPSGRCNGLAQTETGRKSSGGTSLSRSSGLTQYVRRHIDSTEGTEDLSQALDLLDNLGMQMEGCMTLENMHKHTSVKEIENIPLSGWPFAGIPILERNTGSLVEVPHYVIVWRAEVKLESGQRPSRKLAISQDG
ncbi:hypothetical protein PG994_004279 [Apiospora phragmitis]|uniref:Uncharacterized protein n=1 Tax=Apiospora phragmitis TaxID=2905665 RepID=A0ABR1VQ49_9PEZI